MNLIILCILAICLYYIYKLRKEVSWLKRQYKDLKLDYDIEKAKFIQSNRVNQTNIK